MLDQVLIISFDWLILPRVKSLEPTLQTGALVSKDAWESANNLDILVEQVTTLGCNWISMDCELFTSAMPAFAHQHGFKLGLWTVNTTDELLQFAAAGVDSLTSDRPDLFSAITTMSI